MNTGTDEECLHSIRVLEPGYNMQLLKPDHMNRKDRSNMRDLKRALPMTAIMAGFLFSGAVQAQDLENRPNIYGGISWIDLDSKRDIDDDTGFVVGGEYPMSERWSAALELWQNEADLDNFDDESDNTYYRIGGNYHFNKLGQWQPYFAVGMGHVETDPSVTDNSGATGVDLGLGIKRALGNNFMLRGDVKAVFGESSTQDMLVGLSIGYIFGAREQSRPVQAAAPEPAPRQPEPRRDSDGDGVRDSRDNCPGTDPNHAVDANGCVITDMVEIRQTLEVLFKTDKSEIRPEYASEIRDFAEFIKKHKVSSVTIEGHTDSDGSAEYNQDLSQRRAEAIVDRLVNDYGIARSRLKAVGYGENRPVASNDTARGKVQNRRIEAVVEAEVARKRQR